MTDRIRGSINKFIDDGCEVSRSCLDCPLSRCKHDAPLWYAFHRRFANRYKMWEEILRLDLTTKEASDHFGTTTRQVQRIAAFVNKPQNGELLSDGDRGVFISLADL